MARTDDKTGGSAFPWIGTGDSGMSLRDWFAGQALAGLMANTNYTQVSFREAALDAYRYADAMIAVRDRKEKE